MNGLDEKIRRLIEATGPISVADYMSLCLFDPELGYYTTHEPFGAEGDFVTAPEVSQMFGELIAAWLYSAWKECGAQDDAIIAEIGPGRGTLMRDMLRSFAQFDPGFVASKRFALIETSPRLTAVQKETLAGTAARIEWYGRVEELPQAPFFIVGNELFDALPVHQYVKTADGWRERVVGLNTAGTLSFAASAAAIDPSLLPRNAGQAPQGAIFEYAPAREALMDDIAGRLAGGAALFIDYGHTETALGDTLQAVRDQKYADVLASPGEVDLTAHVDFAALARIAPSHGLAAYMMTQADFLLGLGLLERAGSLGAGKRPDEQERIRRDVERLAGPQEMGTLFKVLALTPSTVAVAPFTVVD